jgi:NADH dehydrogenase
MTSRKRLVVVGGGFAGSRLAQRLEHRLPAEWDLTLVSQENFITFNPLLPEVVGASILPGHVIAPHRQMVHCSSVCMAEVTDIDLASRVLHYRGEGSGQIRFDELVLACGSNANLDIIKGMAQYALPLKTLGDALFLRNRVIARLEQAELQPDRDARRWLTTFIIVGGGFSGVETAGELVDFVHASLRYYRNIAPDDVKIVLLHSGACLMPELSESLGRFTERKMRRYGVDVRLNARAVRVTDRGVTLDSDEIIVGGTVVCTIGTQPNPLLEQIPAPKARGRLAVDPDFSVRGIDGLWAVGDCAAVKNAADGQVAPPTAQFAEAAAECAAGNIVAKIAGRPTRAFAYRPKGQLASIGHNKAVAEIFGLKLSGFVAWLMWRGLFLLRIPTFARKSRLFLEWNWAMFFPPDIAHLGYRRTQRKTRPAPLADNRSDGTIPTGAAPIRGTGT